MSRKNVAASVRARLANQARESGRPFQEVLQHHGLERFLYRLSRSPYRDQFLLKGALMLRVWQAPESRPTRDIDLLGYVANEVETVVAMTEEICGIDVPDDGVTFVPSTVAGERIREGADYPSIRIKFFGLLERARIPMRLDVGFGDVVHPPPEERDFPTLLEFPPPRLRTYPRETLIAEKYQAMVYLGMLNTRLKDFFDVWLLARQFDFCGADLAEAMGRTFRHRGTEVDINPVGLRPAFTASVQQLWKAFLRSSSISAAPALDEMRELLREFLLPVAAAVANGREFNQQWLAPGPWREPAG